MWKEIRIIPNFPIFLYLYYILDSLPWASQYYQEIYHVAVCSIYYTVQTIIWILALITLHRILYGGDSSHSIKFTRGTQKCTIKRHTRHDPFLLKQKIYLAFLKHYCDIIRSNLYLCHTCRCQIHYRLDYCHILYFIMD